MKYPYDFIVSGLSEISVEFKGNKNLSQETIKKKIPFNTPAIDEAKSIAIRKGT